MPRVAIFDRNHTILQRVRGALQHGLEQLSEDEAFPSTYVSIYFNDHVSEMRTIESEAGCSYSAPLLFKAVHILMVPIFKALGAGDIVYTHRDAQAVYERNYVVISPERNQTLETMTSIVFETPTALTRHWGHPSDNLDLQLIKPSTGVEAMLIKGCSGCPTSQFLIYLYGQLSIQMRDHDPKARFGVIFVGHSFIVVERCELHHVPPQLPSVDQTNSRLR